MRKIATYAVVFVLGFGICAMAMHAFGANYTVTNDPGKQLVLSELTKPVPPIAAGPGQSIIADAAAKVEPSIVTIDTEAHTSVPADPFQQFFGGSSGPIRREEQGAASGIILSPDGYIITNNHVVAGTDNVKVILSDGKPLSAKVIGSDPTSDIAVVKIDPTGENLIPAQLGDSGSARVGDMVIAVGDPLDVGTTVTFGIVSALGHRNEGLSAGRHPLAENIIQTDAAINPGNSGGALADMNGRIVGINEAIASPNGASVGIGFAIPINSAKEIAADLIKDGKVTRAYLGIGYKPLSQFVQADRDQLGLALKGNDGLVVANVYPGSPAEKAGLKEYDVLLEANRVPLTASSNLQDIVTKLKPGDRIVFKVYRNGNYSLVPVTVVQMPSNFGSETDDNTPQSDGQDQGQGQDPGGIPGFGFGQ